MISYRSTRIALSTLVAGLALSPESFAHEGDYGVKVDRNKLTTWLVDDTGFVRPERVFGGELIDNGGTISASEPGFFAEAGLPIEGSKLGFNITSALGLWDQVNQQFGAISPIDMTLDNPLLGSVTTPATNMIVPGPPWLVPQGGFDLHFDFILNGATEGIYLLEMTLYTDAAGIAGSDKFWTVFNFGLDELEHEAAIEWVENNYVPAPGTLGLLAAAAFGATRRRR